MAHSSSNLNSAGPLLLSSGDLTRTAVKVRKSKDADRPVCKKKLTVARTQTRFSNPVSGNVFVGVNVVVVADDVVVVVDDDVVVVIVVVDVNVVVVDVNVVVVDDDVVEQNLTPIYSDRHHFTADQRERIYRLRICSN